MLMASAKISLAERSKLGLDERPRRRLGLSGIDRI